MKKKLFLIGLILFLLSGLVIKIGYIFSIIFLIASIILIWPYTKDIIKNDAKNAAKWVKDCKEDPKKINPILKIKEQINEYKKGKESI